MTACQVCMYWLERIHDTASVRPQNDADLQELHVQLQAHKERTGEK